MASLSTSQPSGWRRVLGGVGCPCSQLRRLDSPLSSNAVHRRKIAMFSGCGMAVRLSRSPCSGTTVSPCVFPNAPRNSSFRVQNRALPLPAMIFPHICHAKKKNSYLEPVLKHDADGGAEEGEEEVMNLADEDDISFDDFEDEFLEDKEKQDFEDEFEVEDADPSVGDGGAGGGVSFAGMWWDKEALTIAEEVARSFDGDLKIYAFKTCSNSVIRVRIEKLSTKYGSPSMSDIENFSTAFRERLDEAERAGTIPENISFEVSSPGVERVLRVPDDLERFKERAMYVKYAGALTVDGSTPQDGDGLFRLVSVDVEAEHCTWGLADVRVNREKAGKGRPLTKRQREWRLLTPFDSLRLVRVHSDC